MNTKGVISGNKFLADIVLEFKDELKDLSDKSNTEPVNTVSYSVHGVIITTRDDGTENRYNIDAETYEPNENRTDIKNIRFEGELWYTKSTNAGKIIFAPIEDYQKRIALIIKSTQDLLNGLPYSLLLDEKDENKITIISLRKNLEAELQRIEEVFEEPTRREYEI